jgi:hypothetical protein
MFTIKQSKMLVITVLIILVIIIIAFMIYRPKTVEGYKDPIWSNRKKMYNDLYPRSNGTIYGTFYQPWNMFSGWPAYPRAY